MTSPPLILFSGLGADDAVFAPQKSAFPHLIVPPWIVPHATESLSAYCERFAKQISPTDNPILGGASFGGVIALEMARFVKPRAIVLIGSLRDPAHVPRRVRWLRGVAPFLPMTMLQALCGLLSWPPIRNRVTFLGGLARQFRDADPRVVRWSIHQISNWNHTPEVNCPVFQIHGSRDFVLPAVGDGTIIPGGGHVVSLTHAAQVNEFLRAIIEASSNGPSPTGR